MSIKKTTTQFIHYDAREYVRVNLFSCCLDHQFIIFVVVFCSVNFFISLSYSPVLFIKKNIMEIKRRVWVARVRAHKKMIEKHWLAKSCWDDDCYRKEFRTIYFLNRPWAYRLLLFHTWAILCLVPCRPLYPSLFFHVIHMFAKLKFLASWKNEHAHIHTRTQRRRRRMGRQRKRCLSSLCSISLQFSWTRNIKYSIDLYWVYSFFWIWF